jgi:hypothetical protein
LGSPVARLEVVADKCWTKRSDHEIMVLEGCDDDACIDAVEGSGDVRSGHVEVTAEVLRSNVVGETCTRLLIVVGNIAGIDCSKES